MDFSKHLQKAEDALERRNYDFAVEIYRQLVDLSPDLAPARAGLRQALRRREESRRGGRFLRAVGGAVPLARARTLAKLGKHEAAASALEDYLASKPLDEEANLMLGRSLEAAGHYQAAGAVFEFAAEIAPRDPEALKLAGAMMSRIGEPARALEYYERALEADPRDRDALKARKDLAAETALQGSGLDEARHSRELLRDADRQRDLERSTRRHRTADELRAELEGLEERAAEEAGPADVLRRAELHLELGDLEPAADLLERASSYSNLEPALADRVGDLGLRIRKRRVAAASQRGDEAGAGGLEDDLRSFELGELRRRVDAEPGSAEHRLRLGKALLRAEDLDGAAAELQRAVTDPRLGSEARFHLGQCFRRKGIHDLARRQLEQALDGLDPTGDRAKEILYSLGSICEAEGDPKGARAHYVRVYEVDIAYRDVAQKMDQL